MKKQVFSATRLLSLVLALTLVLGMAALPAVAADKVAANTEESLVLPETVLPETVLPETVLPETVLPETVLPETVIPETVIPETVLPETVLPETVLPETTVPETTVPETTVPEIQQPTETAPKAPSAELMKAAQATYYMEFTFSDTDREHYTIWYSVNGGDLTELTGNDLKETAVSGNALGVIFFLKAKESFAITGIAHNAGTTGTFLRADAFLTSPGRPGLAILSDDRAAELQEEALAEGAEATFWYTRKEIKEDFKVTITPRLEPVAIEVTKALTSVLHEGNSTDYTPDMLLFAGDVLTYTIGVTNNCGGDITVNYMTIADLFTGGSGSGVLKNTEDAAIENGSRFELAQGATATFTYEYTVDAKDGGARLSNVAKVTANCSSKFVEGQVVTSSASSAAVDVSVVNTVRYEITGDVPADISAPIGGSYLLDASVVADASVLASLANDNSAWLREGYTFSGWTVEGIAAADIADGTFQMPNTNVVFSANYERITHTVTVIAEDPTHVTTAGAGIYHWGDPVTVTATPAEGYMVTGIYEGDTLVSNGAVFTINSLTEDRAFRVTVAEKMSTITITAQVDTVNFANGDPIFVYAVTSDSFSAVATVRITAGTSGSTTLNVPFGSYTVSTEDAALRYTADEGSMDPQMITVSTTDAYTADFSYHRTTATHFSSTDVVTNTITLSDKFVGGGTTQPQPDNALPQPDNSKPQPDNSKPQPDNSKPQPDNSKPQPESVTIRIPATAHYKDNATEYKFKSDDVAAATGLTYVSTDGDFIFTAAPTAVPASCRVEGYYYVEIINAYVPSWFTLTLTENTDGSFTGAWN